MLEVTLLTHVSEVLAEIIKKIDFLQNSVDKVSLQSLASTKQDEELFIGIDEASEIVGREKSTVYSLVRRRRIPYYKSGKILLFKQSELLEWLKQGKRDARSSTLETIMKEVKTGVRHMPRNRR